MFTATSPRRSVLRGLTLGAGATVLGPLLGRFLREAHGAAPGATRVVFVMSGNGMNAEAKGPLDLVTIDNEGHQIRPGGRHVTPTLYNGPFRQMPPMMAGLAAHRDRILILDDTNNGLSAGHWQSFSPMSCTPNTGGPDKQRAGGKTIDHFLSERIGASTTVPLLTLGVVDKAYGLQYAEAFTASGENQPVPYSLRPPEVAQNLFGAAGGSPRDALTLDHLREDVKRAAARLAGPEKVKLDQYLASVEEMLRRQRALTGTAKVAGCKGAPIPPDGDLAFHETRMEAMADIAASAILCGLTRVVSLSFCSGRYFGPVYKRLGYTTDMHSLGHGATDPKNGRGDLAVHNFHATVIARMVQTLKDAPEGGGSVFDNTVIVWSNDNGNAHHSRPENSWTVVMIGNAGGALKADGRYVRFPGGSNPAHRKLGDVWTTLCNALGVKVDRFNPTSPQPQKGVIDYLMV